MQANAGSSELETLREQVAESERQIEQKSEQLQNAEQRLEEASQQLLSADLQVKALQEDADLHTGKSEATANKQAKDLSRLRRMLEQMHERFNSQQVLN